MTLLHLAHLHNIYMFTLHAVPQPTNLVNCLLLIQNMIYLLYKCTVCFQTHHGPIENYQILVSVCRLQVGEPFS